MIFDVAFTVKAFRRLEDGSQIQVERLLGRVEAVIAMTANNAIALAGHKLEEVDEELLANATVSIRQMEDTR